VLGDDDLDVDACHVGFRVDWLWGNKCWLGRKEGGPFYEGFLGERIIATLNQDLEGTLPVF
jgi:hypothetical protein